MYGAILLPRGYPSLRMTINLQQLVIDSINAADSLQAAADHYNADAGAVYKWRAKGVLPNGQVLQQALNDHMERRPPQDWDVNGDVLLLMPILRSVEGKAFATITKALGDFGRNRVDILTQFNTDIDRARCILADRALLTDAEWFIFLDSDAILPCGYGPFLRGMGYDLPDPNASMNAISRIMSHGVEKKIIAALAFGRRQPLIAANSMGQIPHQNVEMVKRKSTPGETGVDQIDWTGMHFCRIHRSVFEAMREADLPEIKPVNNGPWGYFIKSNPSQSEDGAFCKRAKSIGIDCFLDTTLRVGHLMDAIV